VGATVLGWAFYLSNQANRLYTSDAISKPECYLHYQKKEKLCWEENSDISIGVALPAPTKKFENNRKGNPRKSECVFYNQHNSW
jgi:hypothetical protein